MSHYFVPLDLAELDWKEGLPCSKTYGDIYFSSDNALEEIQHVFIEGNDLIQRWQALENDKTFIIGELGFGTGLNFLLTWQLWKQHAPIGTKLHFITCEKHPLSYKDLDRALNHWPQLSQESNLLLAAYPVLTPGMHRLQFENDTITLTIMLGDAYEMYQGLLCCGDKALEPKIRQYWMDAWYLDGFAPSKNEQMWGENLLAILNLLSKPGTTLATFSAARVVKESLEKVGFKYQKHKGYGYKREMLRASFDSHLCSIKSRQTPWHFHQTCLANDTKDNTPFQVTVIGAGLAGAFCAYELAKRGYHVHLLEKESRVGEGASGNPQAVLFPNISAYRSPLTELMLHGFLYAARLYPQWIKKGVTGEFKGLLQILDKEDSHTEAWLKNYPLLARKIGNEEASILLGLSLQQSALDIPLGGWLDSQQLCEYLTDHPLIHVHPNTTVSKLQYEDGLWNIEGVYSQQLILTGGFEANQFLQTKNLPIKSIKGQMTKVASSLETNKLLRPLCGDAHVLPAYLGGHYCGASYQLGQTACFNTPEEAQDNLKKLAELPILSKFSNEILSNWSGVRGATPNHLPWVGPVPDFNAEWGKTFEKLRKNAKQFVSHTGLYYPGLYIFAGFGSRGLTTIPICAHWLVSLITKEPSILPLHLIKAISPARSIIHSLVKGKI